MFCTNCGTKNADGAKFCTSCGAPLMPSSSVNNQQRQAPAPQSAPRAQAAPMVEEQPSSRPTAPAPEQPQLKRKKSKARIIIPVVAVVVVAAVAVAAVFTNGFGLLGVPVRATVNDYSWEELSKISAQISACDSQGEALEVAKSYNLTNPDGTLDGTQVKQIELTDGTTTEVQILGFYHDDKSDGSGKAGISFIFKDAIGQHVMNSNGTTEGGWRNSEMRSWMNSDLITLLPEDLQSQIVAVDKLTNSVGFTADPDSVATTSDKLWLLSQIELVGPSDGSNPTYFGALDAEGSQYQLFSSCGVARNDPRPILQKRFAATPGIAAVIWWQRSSAADVSENFYYTSEDGEAFCGGSASNAFGVAPAFCI